MQKKPLTSQQVSALRTITQHLPLQNLLLNLGVDLMLRAGDLLQLKVRDVVGPDGLPRDFVRVRQSKPGRQSIALPLSQESRDCIQSHLLGTPPNEFVFKGQKFARTKKPLGIHAFARIVKSWVRQLNVRDVAEYSTHSLRRTKPSIIYSQTGNAEAIRRLLGHSSVQVTSNYLGVSDADATELARNIRV